MQNLLVKLATVDRLLATAERWQLVDLGAWAPLEVDRILADLRVCARSNDAVQGLVSAWPLQLLFLRTSDLSIGFLRQPAAALGSLEGVPHFQNWKLLHELHSQLDELYAWRFHSSKQLLERYSQLYARRFQSLGCARDGLDAARVQVVVAVEGRLESCLAVAT